MFKIISAIALATFVSARRGSGAKIDMKQDLIKDI